MGRSVLALLLFLCIYLHSTTEASPRAKGSEFHFLFGPNLFREGEQFDTQILVTTNESEPVNFWISWNKRITRPMAQSNTTHTVSRGEVEIIDIPHVLSINSNNPRTPDIGIQLQSQGGKELTVVGVNEQQASTDAFLVFPKIETKSKTYEYFALSVDKGPFSNIRSFFGFVTTEPDTTITITPVTTIATFFVRFSVLQSGRNYTATVSAAGTSVAGTATSDISGTRIVSDKPLSFFTGHECGLIPSDETACDHLVEQVPPTETWGFKFFLVPLSTRSGDGYCILASRGGTECNVTCTDASFSETITLANPGDFRQLIYSTRYCSVECNRPVLIFQFSLGHSYDEAARSDPFAVMIPPVGQYSNDYDLVFFESKEVDTRGEKVVFEAWINIAIPAEYAPSGLKFDGSPLSNVSFVDVTCSDGEVCGRVARYSPTSDTGSHKLEHMDTNARFTVTVYGWERENTYGYVGGMNFDSIAAEIFCFKDQMSSASESDGTASFVVTRTGSATDRSCIGYTVGDVSTQGDADYSNTSGECCFEANQKETTCTIQLVVDSVTEDDEVLRITLATNPNQSVCEAPGTTTDVIITEMVEPPVFAFEREHYEVNEASGTVRIGVVKKSGDIISGESVTIDVTPRPGSGQHGGTDPATEDVDYTSTTRQVVFQSSDSIQYVEIPITDDGVFERTEFFYVNLAISAGSGSVGAPNTTTVFIIEEVLTVMFDPDGYEVSEGEIANVILVTNLPYSFDFSVIVDCENGSAGAPGDFNGGQYTVNFTTSPNQPGMSSASIRTLPDNVFECEEYFNCTLIVPDMDMDNVIKGTPDMARVNITDNTGAVVFFDPDVYMVPEGSNATLIIRTTANVGNRFSVIVTSMDDSATSPADYEGGTKIAIFEVGSSTATVTFGTEDDEVKEGMESFRATLSVSEAMREKRVSVGSPDTAVVNIIDNDELFVMFERTVYTVTEGNPPDDVTVEVTLVATHECDDEYVVTIIASDVTADEGDDYIGRSFMVTFPPGNTTASFNIPIVSDIIFEPDGIFSLRLEAPQEMDGQCKDVQLGTPDRANVTIVNDEPHITVGIEKTNYDVVENEGKIDVCLVKSGPSSLPIMAMLILEEIDMQPSGSGIPQVDAASENDDFDPIPVPEVLTIPANFTKICFNVIIKDDPMVEKTETFLISVVFPPNQPALQSGEITATGNGNGTINILDDDDITVQFRRRMYMAFENENNFQVEVVASGNASFPYTFTVTVMDIEATQLVDYIFSTLPLTFEEGQLSAAFTLPIIDDNLVEGNETFKLSISVPQTSRDSGISEGEINMTLLLIKDNDVPTITFDPQNHTVPGGSPANITVVLDKVPVSTCTVNVTTMDIFATSPSDYNSVVQVLVFQPGESSITFSVDTLIDNTKDPNEHFKVVLTSGDQNCVIGSPDESFVTIVDPAACPEYFIFPHTTVGEVATVPCSTDGSESGMYGNIESKCEKGGVWGRVDMSQCTFRRDVPSQPILWMVELRSINLTSLKQSISKVGQAQNVIVKKQGRSGKSDRSVYFIQASSDDIVNSTRSVIGSKLIRESIIMRRKGCNCCENAKIDLFNSKSTYAEICEGEGNIQVPCSCLNGENKCATFYLDEDSKCYLDTDQDNKPDVDDSCIECCPKEFNIFLWPERDYGVTVEANCSEIHPSFGGSKVSRTCRQNDTWDPVDISSCTFKNATRSTPIILFNATVNGSDINEARKILKEQARKLVLGNTSVVNVTVTEVATVETTATNQTVVIFVIEFTENTALVENFTTAIREPSIALKYVQAVIPAESCFCSSNRSNELRRLCIGTATAPCDCNQGSNCECVDPYIREPGGTCTLDTDGDSIADHKDLCPYEFGEVCTKPPPLSKCPKETDSTSKLFWRDTERGVTLYTRCPGGVNVSSGLASRMCGTDGTWGEVDTRNCISRAFQDIEQSIQDVKQVLNTNNALTNKQREVITGITRDLSAALNVDNTLSVLPGDLNTTTSLVEELARLSDNNGLFSGQNNTEQQMAVVGVISGVLNSKNVPAFRANSKSPLQETPAEALLESTELLTRTGFVQQNQYLPPPNAPLNKTEIVVVDSNLVVQSNRLNSLSFTSLTFQVSFPSQKFNDFARSALIPTIVIPGSFLNALTTVGSDGRGTQTPVPAGSTTTLLTPSTVSLTTSQTLPTTPPTVPTTGTNNQTIAKPVDVVSFTMNNLQKLLPLRLANEPDEPDGAIRIEPVSLIVSSQVAGVENTTVDSGETISISFTLLENAQNITVGPLEKKEVRCAFWDFAAGRNGSGGWSFKGIEMIFDNGTHVQCASMHLTSFVVLVSVVPIKKPPHQFFAWITYIGCGISLLCLLLSIVFFLALKKELITRLHNFVHLNLCIALSCGLIFFLTGMEHAAKYKIACQIVSVFQHYFFLAAFCWMLCEAVMIYILIVRALGANDKKWIYLYLVLGWGLPVPVVVVSVAVRHYNYFILNTNNEILSCWLPVTDGLIAAFIGPMLVILLVNAVLLTISMASLAKSKCGKNVNKEMGQNKKENAQTAWQLTKATLILMPLMGFTWVIGLLAVGPGQDVVAIVFVVLNSLQGLFIFLLHVLRHEKVWSKIKARMPTLKGKKFPPLTGPSSETKSTVTRFPKRTAFMSEVFSSMGGHDVGSFGIESKEKPEDLTSISDEEDFEMKIKNGESTPDEQKVEVTATAFGIGEINNKEEEANNSPQPTENKLEQTATTFGISEQNDKEDKTNGSPQCTESKPLLEPTASDQSPPPTITSSGISPGNVTVEYHSPGESDQPPCGGEAL